MPKIVKGNSNEIVRLKQLNETYRTEGVKYLIERDNLLKQLQSQEANMKSIREDYEYKKKKYMEQIDELEKENTSIKIELAKYKRPTEMR
jgi:hypothetical protein